MFGMPNTRDADAFPRVHLCEVVRTRQVTPMVQRVTLGGCGLAGFPAVGADAFAYLLLPPAGRSALPDRVAGLVRRLPGLRAARLAVPLDPDPLVLAKELEVVGGDPVPGTHEVNNTGGQGLALERDGTLDGEWLVAATAPADQRKHQTTRSETC